jgi:signal transduction histidine kinase
VDRLARFARPIAYTIGAASAFMLSFLDATYCRDEMGAFASLDIATVLLVTVAVLPSTFWHMLYFGCTIVAAHLSIIAVLAPNPGIGPIVAPLVVLAFLCAFLAGMNYHRYIAEHRARTATLEARIKEVQAENSASLARVAAALSHEMNSPLGALKSSVASLVTVSERMAERPDPKLAQLQKDLASVVADSSDRLAEMIGRMQRFANLDRAEVQNVDVGRVIDDVTGLCLHKDRVRVRLQPVPTVVAQPQILSGAIANLLQKASDKGGRVTVETRAAGKNVEVRIGAETAMDLEPLFQEQGGRMAAANWDVFHVRHLIRMVGGEVHTDGSGVVLTLPAGGDADLVRAAAGNG